MLNVENERLTLNNKMDYLTNVNDLIDTNKSNQILKDASNYFMF